MRLAFVQRFTETARDIRRFLIIALGLGIAGLVVAMLSAVVLIDRARLHTAAVRHTFEVELAIQNFRVPMWQAEAARRGFIITPNPGALMVYRESSAELMPALDRLSALTMDNPNQIRRIARLRALAKQIMRMRAQSIAAARRASVNAADRAAWIDESVPLLLAVRAISGEMRQEEQRLLAGREAQQAASIATFYTILAIAGMLVVVVAVLTALTLLRYTSDLTRSRDQLRDLADGLEDSVRERTADLTRANDEIQRFAYIVSHDLRAPLVNVLGFTGELETATGTFRALVDKVERDSPALLSPDAVVAAREDLPEAIGFIRRSTQKMDRLINAILKMAREGRRAITPEPLDLDAMVADISATLHHRLDTLGAEIAVAAPLPAITSDRIAVEQILSNLLENSVKYLDPTRPGRIMLSGRREGGQVTLSIADNGRGVDPRDHQRIFDLFRRSGVQDQPGEGIGLAHVRALTYRLGGRIELDSSLGSGATFRLTLPATIAEVNEG